MSTFLKFCVNSAITIVMAWAVCWIIHLEPQTWVHHACLMTVVVGGICLCIVVAAWPFEDQ